MNLLDAIIKPLSPAWALDRAKSRKVLAAYEAAHPTRTRKNPSDNRSGDALTMGAATTLRGQARHLEQNHDLARGALNTLVANIVGAKGIGVEAQPKDKSGAIHKAFSDSLQKAFKDWQKQPESTGEYQWPKAQRLMCRAWLRDGEVLAKHLTGDIRYLDHRTKVPYTLELLEADYIADIDDATRNITQGVERNAWGRPRYFHLHAQHPGDTLTLYNAKTYAVNAEIVSHLKMTDRIRQARGVSVFASVMNRLNDIKDYEESERVAARISAAMAAYIKKGSPDMYIETSEEDDRSFPISPGTMFDNLLPGEEVGTIESNRPSALLQPFRDAMLRAVSAGVGASYSSISKNYDGTYSAQRQELVEQWVNYAVLADDFISGLIDPVWNNFVTMAIASGAVKVPATVDRATLYDAEYICPSMPWIDPVKEAKGHELNLQLKIKSPQQIIRAAGGNPKDVINGHKVWNEELKAAGLTVEAVPVHVEAPAQPPKTGGK